VTGHRPTASVIVCTRNRAALLEGCLESLLAQVPSVEWQVIVVDNASTDETPTVVDRCRARGDGVRVDYVVEGRLGLSHARNRGIAVAEGSYLLLTDDDVLVEPGWVDGLCRGFFADDVAAVAGRVLPQWPMPPPRWLAGRHANVLAITQLGEDPRDLSDEEVPMGANMAIRASLVEGVGEPFDTRLGHRGDQFFAYEEVELFRWLRERGRLTYRPDAVVLHRIDPERMTWRGMRRAAVQNGFGSRRAERLRGPGHVPLRVAAPALARAYATARRLSRRNGGRDEVGPEAAFDELRAYWELGRLIEAVFGGSRLGASLVTRVA